MGKLHKFLNWPNKAHKLKLYPDNPALASCEYCDGVFIVGNPDKAPFGIGAKYPKNDCTRGKS